MCSALRYLLFSTLLRPVNTLVHNFISTGKCKKPSVSLISETPLIDRAIRGMELARDEADFDGDDYSDDETSLISNCSQRCGLGSS